MKFKMAKICHLENRHDVIFLPWAVRCGRNLTDWCIMTCRLRWYGWYRIIEIMANVCFSKPEIVISQPADWLSYNYEIWFADRNWHPKKSDLKPEVKLRRSGRHLENRYNIISLLKTDRFGRNSAAYWHAEHGETGSRIPIWRTVVFQTGRSYLSRD